MMANRKLAILLIDGSSRNLEVLQRIIPVEECTVVIVKSAQQALQIMAVQSIDLIFTTEKISDTSGIELLLTMRKLYPEVTRMMIAESAGLAIAREAFITGKIDQVIERPGNEDELLAAIRHVARMKSLKHENKNLRSTVARQAEIIDLLENKFPGILERQNTEAGAMILNI